jgi:transposase InsO family protein
MSASDEHGRRIPDRWAQLRHAVIGSLLASPPERGALEGRLAALAAQPWTHPVTGDRVHFGRSTIERWFHAARKERRDPLAALARKVRRDRGQPTAIGAALAARIAAQYAAHRGWSIQLHHDNLAALVRAEPALGPMPSYPTLRRHLIARGMVRVHRGPGGHRPGAVAAQDRRDRFEQRSYEVAHVGALWHADFHDGKRLVLLPDGRRVPPQLFAVIDDHARLVCHAQWYLDEDAEALVHGVSQAILKRGLPRALMTDEGGAMKAAEYVEGLAILGVERSLTGGYSPEHNAKIESLWGPLEGRLMAMLEGEPELTLKLLNDATQAWVEGDHNRRAHEGIGGTSPLERFLEAPAVLRPSPSADGLRAAFRRTVARTQRRSDGTFTLDGVRYEIPSRFRTLRELSVRYARWDLSLVELYDPRTGQAQCRVFPIDKVANADGHRRRVDPSPAHLAVPPETADVGVAPYLRELIGRYAATGLLPGYLPTPHAHDHAPDVTEPTP